MRIVFVTAGMVSLMAVPLLAYAEESAGAFSGAHVGVHAGEAWSSSRYTTQSGCPSPTVNAVFCNEPDASSVNGVAVANSGAGKFSPSSFTGGVQAGYNWQKNNFVFGGETSVSALDVDESTDTTNTFPFAFLGTNYRLTERMSSDWLATLRGRAGYTVTPKLLLFATGGAAFTRVKFSSTYADNATDVTFPGGNGIGSKSNFKTGWTVGGGGEWQVSGPWSVVAEYTYTDFGSMRLAVPVTNTADYAQTMGVKADFDTHLLRVGINYRF